MLGSGGLVRYLAYGKIELEKYLEHSRIPQSDRWRYAERSILTFGIWNGAYKGQIWPEKIGIWKLGVWIRVARDPPNILVTKTPKT